MNFFVKEIKKVDRYGTERIVREIRKGRIAAVVILSLFLIITIFSSIKIVPTGFTGIRQTFGQISPVSVEPGFTFVTPYIQKVITIDNRQQDKTFDERIWGETAARTEIYYEGITVSYAIQPEYSVWIYTNLANYKKTLLTSGMVQSAVKSAAADLEDKDATRRSAVEAATQSYLQQAVLDKYGANVVVINRVVIANANFSDAYNEAISQKQTQQIAYERQQIENRQAIEKAEADAKVKETNARAEATAKIIAAEAEAEANQKLVSSLNSTILRKMFYEKWDGVLPKFIGGAQSDFLMNFSID
jgi:regulator of protease activity HflC (stomatin/prohibitin superfamily)